MERITIDKENNETVLDGFKKLIVAKKNGIDAMWEYGGFVTTTDMIPENYEAMDFNDVVSYMKQAAVQNEIGNQTDQEYYSDDTKSEKRIYFLDF